MIAIIDYGMGNLRSVQKGFEKMGHAAAVTRDAAHIEAAGGVVLPGVGAFGACMDGLAECGLVETVHRVVERGTPFLGICVGMQILFSESVEFGRVRGLDILKGKIVRFDPATLAGQKIPHMGWNQLQMQQRPPHLDGVAAGRACISCIRTTRSRMTPRLLPPPRNMGCRLPPVCGREISLPRSFIRKKARRWACTFWPISDSSRASTARAACPVLRLSQCRHADYSGH